MSHPEYVNWVPLPSPVTSGSGVQSYTDPTGDVWVAANGVNGGQWRRARDVLHCNYYRSAAMNWATAAMTFYSYDTMDTDDYGLYGVVGGQMNLPVAGLWRIEATLTHPGPGTDNAGFWAQLGVSTSNTTYQPVQIGMVHGSRNITLTGRVVYEKRLPAGSLFSLWMQTSNAAAVNNAAGSGYINRLYVNYLGTG